MLNMQLRCGTKNGINLKHFEAHIISRCTHDAFANNTCFFQNLWHKLAP